MVYSFFAVEKNALISVVESMYLCIYIFICICGVALLPFLFAAGAMERLLLENSFYSFCSVATAKNVATAKTVSTQYCWKVGPTRSFTLYCEMERT